VTSRRSFCKQTGLAVLPLLATGSSAAVPSPPPIWDLHCHILNASGRTPEEKMERLVEFADRMGIARFCLFKGARGDRDKSPEDLREQNDQLLHLLPRWSHRAFAFVYLNAKHLDFCLREFDRCVRDGPMVGIKFLDGEPASSPRLDPIVEKAAAVNAVIFHHTWWKTGGNSPGESTPLDMAALAKRHPSVPMICGHTGGNWELGIRAVRACKNLSLDLAGSDPTAGFTEMAVREVSAERVIYGSDVSGRSFASQLAKVQGAHISDAAKNLILGENLRRMMAPILKAKGMSV
jgi:predicted TIM-barrel fold metal-dependent hydrolase